MEISVLGFGASPIGNVFDPVDEKEGITAVHYALDQGVNFFDVSPFYGITLAESRLGKAHEGSRKNIILAGKCGRYNLHRFDFSRKKILKRIDESPTRLKTDYLDLFQLHDIEFVDKAILIEEVVLEIQEVVKSGKARFRGITGLSAR
ncbi:aldo/keto reductase [Algoriphagus boritolerans]|uniref:Aldo/keto reductase family protein n=1 Tax=Algoriphagus boritolerans DSM 17298 = JCM 18970 TaxID=1120964 RepID=A0A1H5X4V1_9BACT|nr:aldo/keto reductase [Algoriphagus boritolerans]SEG06761.1 Aldo/keto reductase family protein [Algoriphagus boritolerans DSM 17298 = JCM 18970]